MGLIGDFLVESVNGIIACGLAIALSVLFTIAIGFNHTSQDVMTQKSTVQLDETIDIAEKTGKLNWAGIEQLDGELTGSEVLEDIYNTLESVPVYINEANIDRYLVGANMMTFRTYMHECNKTVFLETSEVGRILDADETYQRIYELNGGGEIIAVKYTKL